MLNDLRFRLRALFHRRVATRMIAEVERGCRTLWVLLFKGCGF